MLTRPEMRLGDAWVSIFSDVSPGAAKRTANALDFVVKDILGNLAPGEAIGTTELGERIWPRSEAKSHLALRRKMFNTLLSNETIATGWRRRTTNTAVNRYGVETHPWEWFNGEIKQNEGRKRAVGLATPQLPAEQGVDLLLKHYGFDENTTATVKERIMTGKRD